MKAGNGQHFEQAYNAQAAVDTEGSMLIVGAHVTAAANDKQQLCPGVESVAADVREVTDVLADAGYYNEQAVASVERNDGPVAYVSPGKTHHGMTVADLEKRPDEALPPNASAADRMRHRLRSKAGRARYALRKQTVEPVFGIIKQVLGFRQFHLRGQPKVQTEWTLVTLAYNVKRLYNLSGGTGVPKSCLIRN